MTSQLVTNVYFQEKSVLSKYNENVTEILKSFKETVDKYILSNQKTNFFLTSN